MISLFKRKKIRISDLFYMPIIKGGLGSNFF